MKNCSICSCMFSLEEEGGIAGDFGVISVQFCPTCLSSTLDMAAQLNDDGWGDSRVATKYIYERVYGILDGVDDVFLELSGLLDELAHNYEVDTGEKIGESNESND